MQTNGPHVMGTLYASSVSQGPQVLCRTFQSHGDQQEAMGACIFAPGLLVLCPSVLANTVFYKLML